MTTLLLLALMGPQAMAPAPADAPAEAAAAPAEAAAAPAAPTDDRLEFQAIWLIELQRLPAASLEPFFEDPRPSVRARATLALARLKDPSALPRLAALAADPDVAVREN
ncbi:HEAT repeat domain-containing protein, partial [Myxococcota bacterium]|nr:HEAT repeat domain-containing protein [Myxococcota bacterium]